MWPNSKTQTVTKIEYSNFDKTQKLNLFQNLKTQIVAKIKKKSSKFENKIFFFIARTLVPSSLEKGKKSMALKCYLIYFWRIFFFLNLLIFRRSLIAALKVVWPGPDQNCRHQQGIVGPKGAGDGGPGNNGRRQVSDRYCTIPFNTFKYFAYFQLLLLEIKPWQQRMIIFC